MVTLSTGISISTKEVNEAVSYLVSVLPYPIQWYNTLEGKQILAMKRMYVKKVVDAALRKDMEETNKRLGIQPKGSYRLVCINNCSLRFVYTNPNGKEVHGIIATYETNGYEMNKKNRLSNEDYHLVWENGTAKTMTRSLLISKILSTCDDDAKRLIDAVLKIKRAR